MQKKFTDNVESVLGPESKLLINPDAIVFEGCQNAMDKVFPADGIIRIRKIPEIIEGDSIDEIKKAMAYNKCPIEKQQVYLKPQKFKLPKRVINDEEVEQF